MAQYLVQTAYVRFKVQYEESRTQCGHYNLRDLDLTSDTKAVEDMKGNRLLLFTSDWAVRWAETHNETLELSEFGNI